MLESRFGEEQVARAAVGEREVKYVKARTADIAAGIFEPRIGCWGKGSPLSEVGKLAVGSKIWRLVANPAEVKEPGFKLWQAVLMVLGVDQGEATNHCGTSSQICLVEILKKSDIDITLWI